MRNVVLACVIALSPAIAHADDDEPRSPTTALALSAGGTAVSALLVIGGWTGAQTSSSTAGWMGGMGLVGIALAPGFGHWYAGEVGGTGLALRLAGGAVGFAGFVVLYGMALCDGPAVCSNNYALPSALLAVGGAAVLTGAIYDIATAPAAARRYNAKHRGPSVMPQVLRTPSGPVMGVGISGRF